MNQILRMFSRAALSQMGFAVDAFTKPDDALANYKPGQYDMLITDIRMPVMTGFDLYREIRKKDANIKIALMTSFAIHEKEFQKMFKDIDVKHFFRKPLRISDLSSRINEALNIQSGELNGQ